MGETTYETIVHEIFQLKQRMDAMMAENQALRQQLADLRDGHGMFVEIAGTPFALHRGEITMPFQVAAPVYRQRGASTYQTGDDISQMATPLPMSPAIPESEQGRAILEDQATGELPLATGQALEDVTINAFSDGPHPLSATPALEAPNETAPAGAVPPDPNDPNDPHAAIRRELIGSFLLE